MCVPLYPLYPGSPVAPLGPGAPGVPGTLSVTDVGEPVSTYKQTEINYRLKWQN